MWIYHFPVAFPKEAFQWESFANGCLLSSRSFDILTFLSISASGPLTCPLILRYHGGIQSINFVSEKSANFSSSRPDCSKTAKNVFIRALCKRINNSKAELKIAKFSFNVVYKTTDSIDGKIDWRRPKSVFQNN